MDKPTVVFTFDDGWIDGYAWQMIYGLPATFFLPSGILYEISAFGGMIKYPNHGKKQPIALKLNSACLGRKQIRTLNAWSCEIGSHGAHHLLYNELSKKEAKDDLSMSKYWFDSWLHEDCPEIVSFAYPAQADAHKEIVHKYFPYIRPNMGHTNPMEFPGSVYLYMWHRAIEQRDAGPEMMCLYCETEQAKKVGARFVTFREACEEGLISEY